MVQHFLPTLQLLPIHDFYIYIWWHSQKLILMSKMFARKFQMAKKFQDAMKIQDENEFLLHLHKSLDLFINAAISSILSHFL